MKKMFMFVFFVVSANVFADTAFDYIRISLANIVMFGTFIQAADYEYDGANALRGAWLERGESISLSRDFIGGVEYFIMATSDDVDLDIDLRLNRGSPSGTLITSNTESDGTPMVTFKPGSSGEYTYTVENYSDESAFVSVIVLRQTRNARFSFAGITEAIANILNYGEASYLLMNLPVNEWILFGGDVAEGGTTRIWNVRLPQGSYFLIGAGDASVIDCDVSIRRHARRGSLEGSTIIAEDTETASYAMADFQATGSNYYQLEVENYFSRNDSAFIFGFLLKS
jgi:hypothetical protein